MIHLEPEVSWRLCDNRVCGSFGRQKVLERISSLHFFSSFPCSVTLSYLPHNLKSRINHTIRTAQMQKKPHEYESAAETATHPSEVIHVGGLNWSAYEGQVVNFCCLLISLV